MVEGVAAAGCIPALRQVSAREALQEEKRSKRRASERASESHENQLGVKR